MAAGQGIHRYQHRNDLQMPHRSYLSVFRVAVAAVLAAAAVAVVMFTYRWPLIGDAQTLASDPTAVIVLSNMRFYRTSSSASLTSGRGLRNFWRAITA